MNESNLIGFRGAFSRRWLPVRRRRAARETMEAASKIDAAVAAEKHRIAELRKQVASLQAEKASLHQQK